MTEEWHKPWQVRWFDVTLVVTLVAAACWRAAMSDGGLVLSLLHGLLLVFLFVTLSAGARRLHPLPAYGFFCVAALLLIAELAVQHLTGLHVNWFLISLLLQPDADTQIGFSAVYVAVFVLATIGVLAWSSWRTRARVIRIQPLVALVFTVGIFVGAQWVYTVAYFDGAARILETRRTLPFFWAPHPYRSNKLLGYVFGPRSENPFAESDNGLDELQTDTGGRSVPSLDLATAPNILIIVADSWRAKDLEENPSLAPNFLRAGENGFLSLTHSSVSNCTHFSMYSLFTGKLATSYGRSRRLKAPAGIIPLLDTAGYDVSTAESIAMDWYNLSDILLPHNAERALVDGADNFETDQQVTQQTLEKIAGWQGLDRPQMHLAFYQGTHYPYHRDRARPGTTNLARYKQAVTTLDNELALIFEALQSSSNMRRTLVIVTSDHGEEFLDEGVVGHASRLTDEQVTVPFMVLGNVSSATVPNSHIGVHDFIMAELGILVETDQNNAPIILTNCDYDHPNGFALLSNQGRFEFAYDDGYLVPTVDTQNAHEKQEISKAAKKLLQAISEDR